MKSIKHGLLLCLSFIFLLVLLNCGSDNVIIKKFNTNDQHNSSILVNARALVFDFEKSESMFYSDAPESVEKVTITITGENISSPIIYDLFNVNGKWMGIIGNIPEGPAFVTAQAFDNNNNLIYESISEVTVVNGETLDLNLVLEPTTIPSNYHVKAPLIKQINISSQKISPNEVVNFEVIAEDPDSTASLNYMWGPNNPGQFDNTASAQTQWTAPSDEGTYQVSITITDQEYLIDHQTVSIEVDRRYGDGNIQIEIGANDLPIITSIIADPTSIDKGETTQLTVNAYDPDGSKLTYSWSSTCPGTFSNPSSSITSFTAASDAEYGPCSLEVEVSDNTLTSSGLIDINISDEPIINSSPEIISMLQSTDKVSPNGYCFFIVRAKDPEGKEVEFNWTSNTGTFSDKVVILNGDIYESRINWIAPDTSTGPFIISVEVTDESGMSSSKNFLPIQLVQ